MKVYENRICRTCEGSFDYRKSKRGKGIFCSKKCSDKGRTSNFANKRFGRLLVLGQVPREQVKRVFWKCLCDCGTVKIIIGDSLRMGYTKSCGCLNRELAKKRKTTHGFKNKRFYNIYSSIRSRCNDSKNPLYGGRGIRCLWKSFEEFRDDMFESYNLHINKFGEKETQIDRINNDDFYCKKNCHWASLKEQAQNKRNNIRIAYCGETKCLREWARILNMNYIPLYKRIVIRKWPIEKAFSIPLKFSHV